MPVMHRRVRRLERSLRSHAQIVQETALQMGKSKEAAAEKQPLTVYKIFWINTLLNREQWHIKRGTGVGAVCLSGWEYFITDTVQNCQHTVTIKSNGLPWWRSG